jgi:hypothetical protein
VRRPLLRVGKAGSTTTTREDKMGETLLLIGAIIGFVYLCGLAAEWEDNRQRRRRLERLRELRQSRDQMEPKRWAR